MRSVASVSWGLGVASLLAAAGCGSARRAAEGEAGDGGARPVVDDGGVEAGGRLDSDGDTIPDRVEGDGDPDRDGTPNDLDLDSDGDGIPDADEAGDVSLETPPAACASEIDPGWDPTGGGPPPPLSDGCADYLDTDSDGDGLLDGEERALGTAACGWDSDGDGASDLLETVYAFGACPEGPTSPGARACDCATDAACVPDGAVPIAFLPSTGETTIEVELDSAALATEPPPDGRYDLTLEIADWAGDVEGVDTRDVARRQSPLCRHDPSAGVVATPPCWTAAPAATLDESVASVDAETFSGALAGTRVRFAVTLAGFGASHSRVQAIELRLLGDGTHVLDRKLLFFLSPGLPATCDP